MRCITHTHSEHCLPSHLNSSGGHRRQFIHCLSIKNSINVNLQMGNVNRVGCHRAPCPSSHRIAAWRNITDRRPVSKSGLLCWLSAVAFPERYSCNLARNRLRLSNRCTLYGIRDKNENSAYLRTISCMHCGGGKELIFRSYMVHSMHFYVNR